MMGKQISRPQAVNRTHKRKVYLYKNLELIIGFLTDMILVGFITKRIVQIAEGVLAKFPTKISSHFQFFDYVKP